MKFKVILFLSTVLISILFNLGEVLAQDSFKHEKISFLGGYSFNSVEFLGKTSHSQTQIFTLGYHKEIKEYLNGNLLWYTTYFIPYIHYTYPKRDDGNRVVSKRGFGVSPIGFLLNKENSKRLSPFIETSGGFIYMESEFPTDDSRKLNYTFDIALGADVKFDSFGTLSFGYKFHHISNAETGSENPGLDSNFIFIKFSI